LQKLLNYRLYKNGKENEMRILCTLVAVLALVGTAGVSGADGKKEAAAAKKMLGTWKLIKGTMAGGPFPEEIVKTLRLELTDGKYKLTGAESPDLGTWKLYTDKKPIAIDITGTDGPNKGKTILGIVEADKDKMKVCYDLSGKSRPAKFESKPKSMLFLAEYERVKK
jgi:uncharacterized protein (TIGR03067 family)